MAPLTQKALLLLDEENFAVDTIPVPKPGPGDILVKVRAVALTPADWKWKLYKDLIAVTFPAILGQDVSGVVEELGEGVTDFKKGDRVCVIFIHRLWIAHHHHL